MPATLPTPGGDVGTWGTELNDYLLTVPARQAVRAASTANITVSPGGTTLTVDGVSLANSDRLLLKDQTAPAENGVYDVSGVGSSVVLTRAFDVATVYVVPNMTVGVLEGTVNADSVWRVNNLAASFTLGTTAMYWTRLYPAYQAPLKDPWLITGHLHENFPRNLAATPSVPMTSGTMRVMGGFVLRAGQVYTNITLCTGTTAAVTPTNQWAALIRYSDRAFLRSSTDQTTGAWAGNTMKTFALSSAYTSPRDEPVYVGIMVAAATPPTMAGVQNLNTPTNTAPFLSGLSNTGATTPLSDGTIATAITINVAMPWASLS